MELTDFVPAPNQQATDLYEIENEAFDRRALVPEAMRTMAPWKGRTLLDRVDAEAVLRLELPAEIIDPWLARHPERTTISYGYVLFGVTKSTAEAA